MTSVVGIVGSGFMGASIAGEVARSRHQVLIFDASPEVLAGARGRIRANLELLANHGIIQSEVIEESLGRVKECTSLEVLCAQASIIIEAVFEDLTVKKAVFAQIDALSSEVIVATNTSSLSVSELAQAFKHPQRFLACHFLHPAHLIPLVEITPGTASPGCVNTVVALMESLGKTPIVLRKEIKGFVAARLQAALLREALYLVSEGVCTAAEVDKAVYDGFGRRLTTVGPVQVADMAGLDVHKTTLSVMFPTLCNWDAPPPALLSLVGQGHLGAKSGQGFYPWTPEDLKRIQDKRDRELLRRLTQ